MRLILNPASKSGKGKKHWILWQKKLNDTNVHFDNYETKSLTHAFELAKDSEEDVVAVGGDGTINQVLNGILASEKNKSMAVLYAGTSPDFCKFNDIPVAPDDAFDCLVSNKKKMIDVVEIAYMNNTETRTYFACSCNIGLGADIARFANRWRKIFGDSLGTGLGAIKSILANKTFKSSLIVNDEKIEFAKTNHIFIIKNPFIASGLKLNLNISPDDGKMYLVVLYDLSRFRLLAILRHLYSGEIIESENVFMKECKTVSIKTIPTKEIEFDGDPHGFTDMTAKIIPQKLSLICGDLHA